jgi:tetratricopeptide (TPR) repeat protein
VTEAGEQAFERAAAHDRAGREAQAIPHYEEALRLGLPSSVRRKAMLGLGSSLRNVERHEDAVAVLEEACRQFPGDHALRAFLALALSSAGRCQEALGDALLLVAEQVELGGYARALRHYAEELTRP